MMLDASGKVCMEMPDSLLGRKICMATKMLEISDPGEAVAGQLSETCIPLRFVRNGSYVEMQQLLPKGVDAPGASSVRRMKPLPTAPGRVKLDLTDLFMTEYRGLGTFPVGAYNSSNGSVMRTHNPIAGQCKAESVFNREGLCGVVCNMHYSMDAHLYGLMKVQGDFYLNCRVAKFLFVPREDSLPLVEKSELFGAKSFSLMTEVLPDRPVEKKDYLMHRDLRDEIVFSIDTLMPPAWKDGVRRAAEQWNKGFEAAGLGRPISVRDMAKGDSVLGDCIIYVPSGMDRYECTLLADPLDGRIYHSSIVLHSNYIDKVCNEYVAQASPADPRARTCGDLPESLMSDIVMAAVMPAMGKSLGLTDNTAASFHGTALQRLDPSYTSVYGVAGSAMEPTVFNYLASEQDFRRGVALTQNCVSPYDIMALSLLYGGNASDDCGIPYATAKDSEGRFIAWSVRGDLSADPIKALEIAGKRQAELIEHLDEWFPDDVKVRQSVANNARGFYARLIVRLTDYVTDDFDRGPSHSDVVKCVLKTLRSLDWMQDDNAAQMYRTNVFRQMCQRCGKAKTLGIIYDQIGKNEPLWEDMLLTELESRAENDADALATIRKMQKRTTDPYIKKRIESIL